MHVLELIWTIFGFSVKVFNLGTGSRAQLLLLWKGVYSKEYLFLEVGSKLHRKCVENILKHRCSLVNLLHILRTSFHRNTSGGLLLMFHRKVFLILLESPKGFLFRKIASSRRKFYWKSTPSLVVSKVFIFQNSYIFYFWYSEQPFSRTSPDSCFLTQTIK